MRNRDKLFNMIEYTKENEAYPIEVIAVFIPSMYELNLLYNKTYKGKYLNISIDLRDIKLKGAIRKAYQLRDDGFDKDERLRYLTT